MAVFRVNKTKNYTVMSNAHLRDKRLSFKAKGILTVMLSLPDNWDYSIAGLETLASDGSTATRTALKELETFGYLIRRAVRENGKIKDWEYNIFETPQLEKPLAENQQVGKRTQLNKDIINNELNESIESKGDTPFNRFIIGYGINIDNYSQKVFEMDFAALSAAYKQSQWLRTNIVSLSRICKEYEKIIGGYYKDYESTKKPTVTTFNLNSHKYTDEELKPLDIDDIEL